MGGRWEEAGGGVRATMLRRIPSMFLICLNLFAGCDTLARRGGYVMFRIIPCFVNNSEFISLPHSVIIAHAGQLCGHFRSKASGQLSGSSMYCRQTELHSAMSSTVYTG